MTNALSHKRPVVIGIVGGIASGKSEVTRMLGAMDASIICADKIAHRVLSEPTVIDSLEKIFGNCILLQGASSTVDLREINRKKLASMVFGDSAEKQSMRKQLEAIVHPRIRQLAKSQLETLSRESASQMIILDAPLLIEGGWLPYCNRVLFVDSPDDKREQRALHRGWTAREWQDRESAQLSLAEKRKYATDVLLNDGTIETLHQQVADFVAKLRTESTFA